MYTHKQSQQQESNELQPPCDLALNSQATAAPAAAQVLPGAAVFPSSPCPAAPPLPAEDTGLGHGDLQGPKGMGTRIAPHNPELTTGALL